MVAVLTDLGVPSLHDVILRDARGLTQIDHIARAPDAVVVLETKHYGGIITGDVDIGARDRAAMIGARLLVAEGRVERETEHAEVPITHLICRKLVDRSDLLNGLMKSNIADSGEIQRCCAATRCGDRRGQDAGEP